MIIILIIIIIIIIVIIVIVIRIMNLCCGRRPACPAAALPVKETKNVSKKKIKTINIQRDT